jgi:hypothetical protein
VNALAKPEVGKYLNDYFVSSFQKVGTFRKVGQQKQGGNVASYFCTSGGQVLHVLAGPVDAATMLREARWVVETRKLGLFECQNDEEGVPFQKFFRQAHVERLNEEYGLTLKVNHQPMTFTQDQAGGKGAWLRDLAQNLAWGNPNPRRQLDTRALGHMLLAKYPLVRVEKVYKLVFQQILGERISTLPVKEEG